MAYLSLDDEWAGTYAPIIKVGNKLFSQFFLANAF
jgi:hypothetical protein